MALFANGLLPASFRGAPFAVLASEALFGRRIALHQYPGKDEPWAEDMGREARRWRFRGFIVTGDVIFLGGPIQLQRALLIAALERKGPGLLTHPTLGVLNVSVARCSVGEDLGAGRMSSVDIEFVESGKKSIGTLLSSSSGVLTAANLCTAALVVDGVRLIALANASGARRQDVTVVADAYGKKVQSIATDATALHRLAAQIPGNFGRFSAGANAGLYGRRATSFAPGTAIGDVVTIASARRTAIAYAAEAVNAAAASMDLGDATSLGESIGAMVQALADACEDPADAIRLLEQLIAFAPLEQEVGTPAGAAVCGMVQRAGAGALTRVVADYQPASADDAAARIAELGAVLGDVATAAADAGDDESYNALRAARGAVVEDLRSRGATLAQVAPMRSARPMPALVLAQRAYRDPTRADQLVTQAADCPSPLFMPVDFDALAA